MKPIDYFENLTRSIATSRLLLQKAHKDGALIEGLCLYVSTIDGFLRLSIIYTRTQKSPDHTYELEKTMLHQDDGEKTYSEKDIYKMALEDGILSTELYDKIIKMYEFRNKAVHRFNISTITYAQIAKACIEFEKIYQEIFDILYRLENGPNKPKELNANEKKVIFEHMLKKIDNGGYTN